MKQRLGIAGALLKDPVVLVLDEPTNGLDPAGMADMRATIRALADSGCTVLLSSHLLGEVEQVCDRVGVLSRGRLVTESTVAELRSGGMLRVLASPVESAWRRLVEVYGEQRVRLDGDGLLVDVPRDAAAAVNCELVRAGLGVHELRWRQPDLEARFLELTGGGSHAA